MSLEMIRNIGGRSRHLGLGAIVALACSACASEETVATVPAGNMAPVMAGADSSSKLAAAPMGYPWTNPAGPSLSTASAKAPVVR